MPIKKNTTLWTRTNTPSKLAKLNKYIEDKKKEFKKGVEIKFD